MPLLPADVQVPLWTPTNIHLRSKAAATASAPSTSHFRRRMGLEAVALPNLSQLFFFFWFFVGKTVVVGCIYHVQQSPRKRKVLVPVVFVVCFPD